MRNYLIYPLLLLVILFLAVTRVSAQETSDAGTAPVTPSVPTAGTTLTTPTAPATSTLPGEEGSTAPVENTTADDNSITPPPAPTPVLPAQARHGSLMVKAGDKEVEWRLDYSHLSTNTVFVDGVAMLPVMVIGQVGVQSVRKDILIASLALRYGVIDNVQAEIRVPYRYEHDLNDVPSGQSSELQESTITGNGVGDIEGNLYFQLPRKSEKDIRWIGNIGIKTATGRDLFQIDPTTECPIGTGFWSTKLGLTGVELVDPAALYWNFGYTYNWERKNICVVPTDQTTGQALPPEYLNVKPGDTIDVGGGFAYALNPRLSINTGVDVSFNGSTTSDNVRVDNTCITSANLRLGMIWLTEKGQPIDLSVSVGLTNDSPDFTLTWRQCFKL